MGTNGDIIFAGNDGAPIHLLDGHRGRVIYTRDFAFTIIGNSLLLGEDVTTFWAGLSSDMDFNYWSQSPESWTTVKDSALSFS